MKKKVFVFSRDRGTAELQKDIDGTVEKMQNVGHVLLSADVTVAGRCLLPVFCVTLVFQLI